MRDIYTRVNHLNVKEAYTVLRLINRHGLSEFLRDLAVIVQPTTPGEIAERELMALSSHLVEDAAMIERGIEEGLAKPPRF